MPPAAMPSRLRALHASLDTCHGIGAKAEARALAARIVEDPIRSSS